MRTADTAPSFLGVIYATSNLAAVAAARARGIAAGVRTIRAISSWLDAVRHRLLDDFANCLRFLIGGIK